MANLLHPRINKNPISCRNLTDDLSSNKFCCELSNKPRDKFAICFCFLIEQLLIAHEGHLIVCITGFRTFHFNSNFELSNESIGRGDSVMLLHNFFLLEKVYFLNLRHIAHLTSQKRVKHAKKKLLKGQKEKKKLMSF